MDSIISTLDHNSRLMFAIYAMYDVEGSESRKVKTVMAELLGRPFLDMKTTASALTAKGLLTPGAYNWRTDTFDYSVSGEHLISTMICLCRDYPDMTAEVRDACKSMTACSVKRLLWRFIRSGFRDVAIEEIDDHDIERHIDYFVPVVTDQRFAPLLMTFSAANFVELLEHFFLNVFYRETLEDVNVIRTLIGNFNASGFDRRRYYCLLDLYAFLAYGERPDRLLADNKNHRVIAAFVEAQRGDDAMAYEHFRQALALHNKQNGSYMRRITYLPFEILNFYLVLICRRCGTETSRRSALGVYKAFEQTLTSTAKTLFEILYGGVTDSVVTRRLKETQTSEGRMHRVLATFLCHYTGRECADAAEPRWLFLRGEMRGYYPMGDFVAKKVEEAYGDRCLLTSIYHKQEWEHVLEELGSQRSGAPSSEKTTARIAYFLDHTDSQNVTVRLQTRLKSGQWGAGKSVSVSNFADCLIPEMNVDDRQLAKALTGTRGRSYDFIPLDQVLRYIKGGDRLYVGRYSPYTLVDLTEAVPYINLVRTASGFMVRSNVPLQSVKAGMYIEPTGPAAITYIPLTEEQKIYYSRLLSLGQFPLEAEGQLREFLKGIGGVMDINSDLIEGGSTLPMVDGRASLTVRMRPGERGSYVVDASVMPLEGGRLRCRPGVGDDVIVDTEAGGRHVRVRRSLEEEAANMRHLCDSVGVNAKAATGTLVIDAYNMLSLVEYAQQHPESIQCEWQDGARMTVIGRSSSAWGGVIKKNANGWFEIEGTVEVDRDKVLTMAQLLDLVSQSSGRYIRLGEGEYLALSDKLHRQLMQLSAIASRSHGRLQVSPFAAALLGADMLGGELTLEEDGELRRIRENIRKASEYSPAVPDTLQTTLRKYQEEGYRWMARLNKWGAGALLADDMGLGKTVQTIALLLANAAEGPALVVAPASVAPNWKTELERFAPSLSVTILNYAEHRQTAILNAGAGDVVITTYGLLLSVKDDLVAKHWHTICLDEAHIIKNRGAKTSAVAMRLRGDNRIMLTGTPVQNHLGELWSLFQFVNPGLLGSFEDFNRRFIVPIEQNGDKERQKLLDRLVKPFMLRRTKDKVAKELPEKEEIYQRVTLSGQEMLIYEVLRSKAEAMLEAEGGDRVSMSTLAEITRLRQCSCDMRLVKEGRDGIGGADFQGSKIVALLELLQTILEGFTTDREGRANGGVLVFSQFTSYLALIRQALDNAGISYLYIDGTIDIKTRQKLVEEFQNGECSVFLISLKAGGLGLNLTRANYVIHTDPWWNPAIEAQATDRAHRIGQRQTVTVYHLIAEGTIEEKIQRLHERKRTLVRDILDSTDTSYKLTGEELLEMVRL